MNNYDYEQAPDILDILRELDTSENEYYEALSISSDDDFQIHFKRPSNSCFVNNYFNEGLLAWQANDSDAFNESYHEIYPPELQLKCEHSGDHATFLELDITIVDGIFVYKLFDKTTRRPVVVVNNHSEKQHTFKSDNVLPDEQTYSEIAGSTEKSRKNIKIISDSIPYNLWSTTRFYSWSFAVQHFYQRYLPLHKSNKNNKLC